jgi:AcrR family transcriptional regulator
MAGRRGKINQMIGCFVRQHLLALSRSRHPWARAAVPPSEKTRKIKDEAAKPRRPRTYLRAAERRKLIIAAAQEVFSRTNLQGARTRDIAKAAEINQATIFEHFESKEALFHAAVVQPLIDAMRGMHERVELYETASSPAELAELAHASAAHHIESMAEIFPLLTAALFSESELGARLYREQVAPLIRQRGEVLRSLVKDGIDPEFVGLASFGMLFALAMDRYFGGRIADLTDLATQFTHLSTSGFAKDKGKSDKPGKSKRERNNGPAT